MPVELPVMWVIGLNIIGWPVIQLGVAWIFTRMPRRWFASEPEWTRPRGWEIGIYGKIIRIRQWKLMLPDGGTLFAGFAKRNLRSTDAAYLASFVEETRRGEAAHWLMILAGGVFLIWNPLWADAVMLGYALMANLPCIFTQRYNRWRLVRALDARRSRSRA
jgi:glycosyl-4,4'-diaponeurosporenoate acyltransferase